MSQHWLAAAGYVDLIIGAITPEGVVIKPLELKENVAV